MEYQGIVSIDKNIIYQSLKPLEQKVPKNVLLNILSYLNPADLTKVSQLNKTWKNLVNLLKESSKEKKINTRQIQDDKLNPSWINNHPDEPLSKLGLSNFDELLGFVKEFGNEIRCLNLRSIELDDHEFKQLIEYCDHLTHVAVSS